MSFYKISITEFDLSKTACHHGEETVSNRYQYNNSDERIVTS